MALTLNDDLCDGSGTGGVLTKSGTLLVLGVGGLYSCLRLNWWVYWLIVFGWNWGPRSQHSSFVWFRWPQKEQWRLFCLTVEEDEVRRCCCLFSRRFWSLWREAIRKSSLESDSCCWASEVFESEEASELGADWRFEVWREAIMFCDVLCGEWNVSGSYGTIPAFSR